jgi:hypothetical protein
MFIAHFTFIPMYLSWEFMEFWSIILMLCQKYEFMDSDFFFSYLWVSLYSVQSNDSML